MLAFQYPKASRWPTWPTYRTLPGVAPKFYINPSTGNDSNDGRSPATAWASLANYTRAPAGDWANPLSRLNSTAARVAWAETFVATGQAHTGAHLYLDTSGAPLVLTAPVNIGKRCLIWATPNTKSIVYASKALPNSGWTQPDAGGHSKVYKLTQANGGNVRGLLFVSGVQATCIAGYATYAGSTTAILNDLQANVPGCYPDPATGDIYISSNTSPNSDGVARRLAQDLTNGADNAILSADGGLIQGIKLLQSGTYDPTQGVTGAPTVPITQSMYCGDGNLITVFDHCEVDGYTKHGFQISAGNNGSTFSGLFLYPNCVAGVGPTGFSTGTYSGFQMFLDANGPGTIVTYGSNCTDNASGWGSHNNGHGPADFAEHVLKNSGVVGIGVGAEVAAVVTSGNTYSGLCVFNAPTTSTGDTFTFQLPQITTTATFTNPTITTANTFASIPVLLSGTVALVNQAIDLTAGSANASAWTRSGTIALSMTGGTLKLITNATYGLLTAFNTSTDTFALSGITISAPADGTVLTPSLNGGGALTWNTAKAGGTTGITFTGGCTYRGAPVGTGNPASLYTVVAHAGDYLGDNGGTSAALNTTGCNLLIVYLPTYQGVAAPTLTDSKSNTWTRLTEIDDSTALARAVIYYCINPTVGSGHTFTATGSTVLANYFVIGANKASGTPIFDQQGGANDGGSNLTSLSPGSKTPVVAGSLIVTGGTTQSAATLTVDSGYTVSDTTANSGHALPSAFAYLLAGNIAATAPLWTSNVNNLRDTVIAVFK